MWLINIHPLSDSVLCMCEHEASIMFLKWSKVLWRAPHNTFKKLKQNFQLHFFYSDTENGIKTQVWCTLIAHLLLQVIQVVNESKKAFSTIAALIRIHLISHLDLAWVITEGRKAYTKRGKSRNKSPTAIQMSLF